jgi:isopenicillin-N N-acyltransferase-like protein
MEVQKQNLIITKIIQEGKPTIQQVTEAGIIGKIGCNSSGVGTCLNAIRIKGVDATHLPVHLGLRMALESNSAMEAVQKLEACGMASSAHILISDPNTAIGLEFSASTFAHLLPDTENRVIHANHMLLDHPGVVDTAWLKDSPSRVARMSEMSETSAKDGKQASWEEFSALFEDETSFPVSICRAQEGSSDVATLFNIVMDLKARMAVVRMGRPCEPDETITLSF